MCENNTLYLECYSGISGDMTVAALLDLGATEENIRETLRKLPLSGYEIKVGRVNKNGAIDACDFDVIVEEQEHHHEHNHEASHESGTYTHTHEHRTWKDIEKMLDEADLKPEILAYAKKMFCVLAEAEGKVHGKPAAEVHFHEVGAIDSIVDIVSVATCLDELKIGTIFISELWEGYGHVRCQHGILPVPVPAVMQIVKDCNLVMKLTGQEGEMVTPTGAAIASLATTSKNMSAFREKAIGIGAGKREFSHANILRAMLISQDV